MGSAFGSSPWRVGAKCGEFFTCSHGVSCHREDELLGDAVACNMGAIFRRVVEIAYFGLVLGGDGVNWQQFARS